MASPSGRYRIVFNGEIYNHPELREDLVNRGFRFGSTSDSEVLATALDAFGIRGTLPKLTGMFAIAIWDREKRALTLVRDRMGIKPLYYDQSNGGVRFASELRALLHDPGSSHEVDPVSLENFLRYLYVPGSASIISGIKRLPPGHLLTIRHPGSTSSASEPFWDLIAATVDSQRHALTVSDDEAIVQLEDLLQDVIAQHAISDVPLGAFLSGGIDSSLIAAILQNHTGENLRTFSVGFEDPEHNEAPFASEVAAALGTSHTEFVLTDQDALNVVPSLTSIYSEPLADISQIPMILLSSRAREHVTVALSGDAGDEIFGGYNRYHRGDDIIRRASYFPPHLRKISGAALGWLSSPGRSRAVTTILRRSGVDPQLRLAGSKFEKLGRLLQHEDPVRQYLSLITAWDPVPITSTSPDQDPVLRTFLNSGQADLYHQALLTDQLHYLSENQLAKVDRASMAAGLEVRVPLADHRVVEFAWRLPKRMKVRDGTGKWILRSVLYRHVARELVDRPKMGLSVPVSAWLRGALRPWAEELLSERVLGRDPLLCADPIRASWAKLLSQETSNALGIWAVLMYLAWRDHWSL